MRIAASGANPLLAMTVEMSWVKNIGHSEGEARGNPLLFFASLPPEGEAKRAANSRPYTLPLIHVAQVCHTSTCPYGQISSGEAGFHTREWPLYFTHEVDFI